MKQLKILHLTTHLNIGGITSYLLLLSEALVKAGHSVTVLSAGGEREADFQRAGVRTVRYPIRTKNEFNPRTLWLLPRIARWAKEERFDCFHAHTRVTQVMAHFLSRMTGIPVVTTAHGFFKPRAGRRLLPAWGERAIAISPLVAQDLASSHAVDAKRIRKIYNAVDADRIERKLAARRSAESAKKEWGIPEDAIVLTSVSRLVEDKGHAYLIDAAAKLSAMYSNLFLFIIGDGREKEALERRIEGAGLKNKAKIVPSVSDTAEIYAATDIFVHPATYREGFGLAMAEAMIASKPVIVTDIPATNSLIFDGENGFVVPPKDADALAKKIHFILENPVAAREVAERGRAWAKDTASLERFVKETEAVYREVIR
jgi:glycosyltransferase involved in cell wall biosynthesis